MKRNLDPFDETNVHYKRLGIYPTACGQPWLVVTRIGPGSCTDVLTAVTCPYCLSTEEYQAQGMEEALVPKGSGVTVFPSTAAPAGYGQAVPKPADAGKMPDYLVWFNIEG